MNKMLSGMNNATNYALTENGAVARGSTNSKVLDFFSQGGAMRGKDAAAINMLDMAWNENPELALKTMFYFRDVRGGQGQREVFRNQMKYLANRFPETMRKNLHLVPEYGRWDDLYSVFDTELQENALDIMQLQFKNDVSGIENNDKISLLAKWLKSENASSVETKRLAKITRRFFGMDAKVYRKWLSAMRSYLNVVENQLSSGKWEDVDYKSVPSNAMMKYRKAFWKHDEARFNEFIKAAEKGEVKINSSTLYPYEIVEKIRKNSLNPSLAQAQWTQLPDYVEGNPENSIAVVDVSASMSGTPMNVAISLGLYLAERATGTFADHFITFSKNPTLEKVKGTDITSRVKNMANSHWGYNTNLEAVFDLILNTAVGQNLHQDEMIDKLYIISDMEFDSACSFGMGHNHWEPAIIPQTLMQSIADKFARNGYVMPKLVFWNVDAKSSQVPMSMDDRGFQNVSGFSPSIFASLMSGEFVGAYELMLNVITSDRYAPITL